MALAKANILVVDDSPATLEILDRNLTDQGYSVRTAPSVAAAVEILEHSPVDLVITDLKMPRIGGLDLVRYVRENFADTEVMMITGYATIESAVEAVRRGAEEYLAKPFTDEELLSSVGRVLDKLAERRATRKSAGPRLPPHQMIGESAPMRAVYGAIEKSSRIDATVLVTGESGVGKELVARAIHSASPRAAAAFVPINCGAIPENLFESQLFGHVKGAFTGADANTEGFFASASGGTLFLDEVGELSPKLQVKLLRVLQDGELFPVGSTRPRNVDVRVVAATNSDISPGQPGAVREDLFFRLSVITIKVPPLRERNNDILLLAAHFAEVYAAASSRATAPRLNRGARAALKRYGWPGNVRELENLIHNLVFMTDNEVIAVPDLPEIMRFQVEREPELGRTLAEVEADYFQKVLASVSGNKTRAAEILGIDRKTLREKLKRLQQS